MSTLENLDTFQLLKKDMIKWKKNHPRFRSLIHLKVISTAMIITVKVNQQ